MSATAIKVLHGVVCKLKQGTTTLIQRLSSSIFLSKGITEKEWVIPEQVTESYTSSVTFIKQLTLIAISHITYAKNAFPEDSYYIQPFAGVDLRILNDKCSDDLAQFVSTALQQAFEAFEKKYVHQLALCFYENECQPENLIEYHIFEYSYTPEGVTLNINSKNRNSEKRSLQYSFKSVMQRTTMFVRSLIVYMSTQTQRMLPINYDISLRLYYNENAPEGYQAPGFNSTETHSDHLESTMADAVRLGSVDTPYHSLVARSYTRADHPLPASDEAVPSLNPPVMTQADKDFRDSVSQPSRRTSDASDIQLRCACNKFDVVDQVLINCKYCYTWQHAVCFGYLHSTPREHCCVKCSDENPNRTPSDRKMMEMDNKRRECLCIFRRTLEFCSHTASINGNIIVDKFGIDSYNASRMLKLLQSHSVVPNTADHEDMTVERRINPKQLKRAFQRFFREESEEDSMVDRLMAKIAAAQETSDPLGEVLSPLEKINLHNTSKLGQIIENPAILKERTNIDDATLQQYRQALTNEDITEELPLSGSHNPVKNVEKIGKKKSMKRRNEDDDDDWVPKLPKLRSGAKTKKVRATS